MDENDIKLLSEIESLKSQIAELRMALAGMENAGGACGSVGAMLVPVGQLGGQSVTINVGAGCQPAGSTKTSVKLLDDVLLEPMTDSSGNADSNIKFEVYEGEGDSGVKDGISHIKIGVYYV